MIDKLFKPLDDFLNFVTMYRLMLYYLIILWFLALALSFLNLLPFTPVALIFSTVLILLTCYISNIFFEKVFRAITNFESTYISALILTLIITPSINAQNIQFAIAAGIISMASKYILALNKKHIFNPAAIGVLIPSLFSFGGASWWAGAPLMNIAVLLGGVLIVRKIQRFDLVLSFLLFHALTIIFLSVVNPMDIASLLMTSFATSSILFFASVMLTEPSTTPPARKFRVFYAGVIGMLSFFQTFELALIVGNIFSYIFSHKEKLMLKLKERIKLTNDTYEFVFSKEQGFLYEPGQYLEWTIETKKIDRRGNRRFFTIASSPTEKDLKIGIKVYDRPSSFKNTLMSLKLGDKALAGNLAGDFVLPKETKSLIFVAGGIGITPFRSMIKYLLDKNIKRQIVLYYSNKNEDEIVYKDIFDEAERKLNIKTVYNLTDINNIGAQWRGYKGRLNEEIIKKESPEYKNSIFYLSGPHAMVVGFEDTLLKMGVNSSQVKKDFFPGYV